MDLLLRKSSRFKEQKPFMPLLKLRLVLADPSSVFKYYAFAFSEKHSM